MRLDATATPTPELWVCNQLRPFLLMPKFWKRYCNVPKDLRNNYNFFPCARCWSWELFTEKPRRERRTFHTTSHGSVHPKGPITEASMIKVMHTFMNQCNDAPNPPVQATIRFF